MARPVQSQALEGGLRRCTTGRVCCVLSVSVWWRSAPPLPADRVHLYLTILGQFLPTPSNEKETKLINDGDCGFWLRNIIRGANSCLLLSHQVVLWIEGSADTDRNDTFEFDRRMLAQITFRADCRGKINKNNSNN